MNRMAKKRGAYSRRRTDITRDEAREPWRAQTREERACGYDVIKEHCDQSLRARGILTHSERRAQKRAAWEALQTQQHERRMMVHKDQGKEQSESMAEAIARDERRKERDRLASVARKARANGIIKSA